MGKLLLLILFCVFLYLVLKRGQRPLSQGNAARTPAAEVMIACAHCRIHVPLSEAIVDNDQRFCCEEHRRLGQR
jgi:uncharacterized protein